jgi:hypothetical protein
MITQVKLGPSDMMMPRGMVSTIPTANKARLAYRFRFDRLD